MIPQIDHVDRRLLLAFQSSTAYGRRLVPARRMPPRRVRRALAGTPRRTSSPRRFHHSPAIPSDPRRRAAHKAANLKREVLPDLRAECVAYVRFSGLSQKETSIERQIELCKEYAARQNWTIARIYIDRAKTATTEFDRPGFAEMKRDAEARLFKRVVCEEFDRLHREEADAQATRKEFEAWLVEIHEVGDGLMNRHSIRSKAGAAEEYIKTLKNRVSRGRRQHVEGKNLSMHRPMFGHALDPHVRGRRYPHPDRWPAVVEMFERFVKTEAGLQEIGDGLTGRFPTPGDCSLLDCGHLTVAPMREWTGAMVRAVLRNPGVTGCIFDGAIEEIRDPKTKQVVARRARLDDEIRKGHNEAWRLVSDDLFLRAQERLDQDYYSSSRAPRSDRYLLTGLLRCARCGEAPIILYVQGDALYVCPGSKTRSCAGFGRIDLIVLERLAIETALEDICDEEELERFEKDQAAKRAEKIAAWQARLDAQRRLVEGLDRELDRLVKSDLRGFSDDRIVRMRKEQEAALTTARAKFSQLHFDRPRELEAQAPTVRIWLTEMLEDVPFRRRDSAGQQWRRTFAKLVPRIDLMSEDADASPAEVSFFPDRGPLFDDTARSESDKDTAVRAEPPIVKLIPTDQRRTVADRRHDAAERRYGGLKADLPSDALLAAEASLSPFAFSLAVFGWNALGLANVARFMRVSGASDYVAAVPERFGPKETIEEAMASFIGSGAFTAVVDALRDTPWAIPTPDRLCPNLIRPTPSERRLRLSLGQEASPTYATPLHRIVALRFDGVSVPMIERALGVPNAVVHDALCVFAAGGPDALSEHTSLAFSGSCALAANDLEATAATTSSPLLELRFLALARLAGGQTFTTVQKALDVSSTGLSNLVAKYRLEGPSSVYGHHWDLRHGGFAPGPSATVNAKRLRALMRTADPDASYILEAVAMYLEGRPALDIRARHLEEFEIGIRILRGAGLGGLERLASRTWAPFEAVRVRRIADESNDPTLRWRYEAIALAAEGRRIAEIARHVEHEESEVRSIFLYWRVRARMCKPYTSRGHLSKDEIAVLVNIVEGRRNPSDPDIRIDTETLLDIARERFGVSLDNTALTKILRKHGARLSGPRHLPPLEEAGDA